MGTEVAGVILAALLAKHGRRVLLIDTLPHASTPLGADERERRLSTWVPGLGEAAHITQVNDILAVGPQLRGLTKGERALSWQVCHADWRLDLTGDKTQLLNELSRGLGVAEAPLNRGITRLIDENTEIGRILARGIVVPPETLFDRVKNLWAWRNHRHLLSAWDADVLRTYFADLDGKDSIVSLLMAPSAHLGHAFFGPPARWLAVRHIMRAFLSGPALAPDIEQVRLIFMVAAKRWGATIKHGAVAQHLHCSQGKLRQLTLDNERVASSADHFVDNTRANFVGLLPEGPDRRAYQQWLDARAPAGARLILRAVVDAYVVPACLQARCLIIKENERLGIAPITSVMLTHQPGEAGDTRLLWAMASVPWMTGPDLEGALAVWRQQILAALTQVIPFLPKGLREARWLGRTEPERTASNRRSHWALEPLYATETLGRTGGTSRKTPIGNLWHLGPSLLPSLSLEGDYLAAWGAFVALRAA